MDMSIKIHTQLLFPREGNPHKAVVFGDFGKGLFPSSVFVTRQKSGSDGFSRSCLCPLLLDVKKPQLNLPLRTQTLIVYQGYARRCLGID